MLCAGKNIWRKEKAENVAFLIDAADYYATLVESFQKAQESIYILAWDVNSQVELIHSGDGTQRSVKLCELLLELVEARPELRVYVLCWHFPLAYSPGRETPLSLITGWESHDRIFVQYDDTHPVGACHHQKVVVIDDALAFSGGIDICQGRWDTQSHQADDPLRVDSDGDSYPPFHDIQMMVDSDVARALGELFRTRWKRATDEVLPQPRVRKITPPAVPIDIRGTDVGISLTNPRFGGFTEQREVEEMTLAAIASARKLIYIENQFLTADRVVNALRSSLQRAEGPEIIIVLPLKAASIIEEMAVQVLQNRSLRRLKHIDRYQRLGVFYPAVPGCKHGILVHSKLMICDDEFVKIGSSNLNNRSMGLDTECDLSIEALGNPQVEESIRGLRERLLCEHLGLESPAELQVLSENRTLVRSILSRADQPRALRPLNLHSPYYLRWLIFASRAFDPPSPLKREQVISDFLKTRRRRKSRLPVWGIVAVVFVMLGLAAYWHWLTPDEIRDDVFDFLVDIKFSTLVVVVSALLLLPPALVALIIFTLLGPRLGFVTSWIFLVAISFFQYFVGIFLPKDKISKLAIWGTNTLGQQLVRLRALPDIILRLLPAAPLPILSLISGTIRMPLVGFFFITVFGALPLLLSLMVLQTVLEMTAKHLSPTVTSFILVLSAMSFLILILVHPKGRNILKRGYR